MREGLAVKRRMAGVGLALLGVVLVAAAAQVTREEFDGLAAEVRGLKAEVALLKVQVKDLRAAPQPAQAPAAQVQVEGAPLEGRDLAAWKLARDQISGDMGYALLTSPRATCMTKTTAGDYVFVLYTGVIEGPRAGPRRQYTIYVTDYGSELRVYDVDAQGAGIVQRHSAGPAMVRGAGH